LWDSEYGRPQANDNVLMAATWWSFGRDRVLLHRALDDLDRREAKIHDYWTDPDLNRTLIAFTGEHGLVGHCLCELAELLLPSIDLRRHGGTHPRTGALDEVRISPLSYDDVSGIGALEVFADFLSSVHQVPVFSDGPDSDSASEARILDMRKGGFGSLEGRILDPDYGPPIAHEQWGVTTVLVGPVQLQAALEIHDPTCRVAASVAGTLEELRSDGDPLLLGVRAEGLAQPTKEGSLLLLTFELPEQSWPDKVLKVAEKEAKLLGAAPGKARALGVWRTSDLATATRLNVDESKQVWDDIFI
jgi:hypothetical protein